MLTIDVIQFEAQDIVTISIPVTPDDSDNPLEASCICNPNNMHCSSAFHSDCKAAGYTGAYHNCMDN